MPIERPRDVPLGMPPLEALWLATDVIRRRYLLAETMQHPAVKSECLQLAYLIHAYGRASTEWAPDRERTDEMAVRNRRAALVGSEA